MDKPQIGLLRGKGFPLGPVATRYPTADRTLLRVLRDQAAERGSKDWVIFDSTDRLTYSDAWSLTCRVANAVERDAGEGAHVGLFLLNQVEFLPTFFGAMANKGLAVPLNAQARGPILQYAIEFSDSKVIVARTDLLERLSGLDGLGTVELIVAVGDGEVPPSIHGAPVVGWDEWINGVDDAPPEEFPDYRDPCLIQFTSGTTGNQKGALCPHQFLYLYPAMYVDSIGLTSSDVLSTPMPLYHVAALHLIANSALHCGATAHLKSKFSASRYWDEAAADEVTFSIILGPMAAIVMKSCETAPDHALSRIFCVPPPPELDEFETRFRTKILWHAFGQTEISPFGMRPEIIPGVAKDTLGYPVDWMEYGVVDEHDRLLPPEETGEMVFRPLLPYAMFSGYYKNPEATQAALRNLMFHTGDLASYDSEGLLHYKGRRQERIRHRGENISAPELEYVVLRHPEVIECAAYGVPSEFGEEDVKLDVRFSGSTDPQDFHAWLVDNLPKYMVPRYIEVRDGFPKTPSERIQKYLLKELSLDRAEVHDFDRRR